MENRAGYFKSNLSGEMAYKSFVPRPLSAVPPIELSEDMVRLLIKANAQLAVLESVATRIPNVGLFVAMYVRKEALMSSQIEGTQATLEDVLDPMLDINANRNVAEVVNYIKATEFAIQRLRELPLCNSLIKEIHAILMEGVRGQEKSPGEFRRSQNWIGGQGSTLKNARYIPPSPDDMVEAMSDLDKTPCLFLAIWKPMPAETELLPMKRIWKFCAGELETTEHILEGIIWSEQGAEKSFSAPADPSAVFI